MKVDKIALTSEPILRSSLEREVKLLYLKGLRESGRVKNDDDATRFLESAKVVWKLTIGPGRADGSNSDVDSITIEWDDTP